MNTNALRLETKDDSDIETKAIETALANMTTAFETHKKASNDNDAAQKKRIDDLELRLNRPGGHANDNKEPTDETKAFEKYIRRGAEALGEEVKSLRVSDNTAGGYLSPDEFNAELDRNVVLFSPVRQVARVLPTGAPAVLWPKRLSGFTASWVGETGARPETTATFGQSRYPIFELAAWVDVANAMLEDSTFDVASMLSFEFAQEFGLEEGKAFVNGASALSPSGFMQDAGVAYTPTTSATAVLPDSLFDIYHAVKSPYRANAVWGMNSNTLGYVRKLKDGQGNYLLSHGGVANAPITTILGNPVVEMPDMPDIAGGAFPIVFGDFSQGYRIFDRVSLSVLRDPYSQATNGATRFHGRRRVAGGVGKAEAIRKLKVSVS
ncbi:phage major capsid protein [Bradyrhizobium sp. 23]|uniref:phage major capsid protein n=1 Tax=Bradyrhizobium sp. 23 TaxID=2782667 RepID=UPI001FF7CE87|nr:phage major capsid protein [Bradyrhizobium sp. 23]MCK1313707.1 phage major capsid protein [Bradyrhizobium sp. 23]